MSAATSAHATKATTSVTRSSPPRPPVRRRSSSAATTSATVLPNVCASDRPERRRVVAEEEVADDDRRPQPDSVEEEDGQADSGGRPQRRDRAVEVGELEADAAGEVVRERDDSERRDVAAGIRSADETYAHGPRAESSRARQPGSTSPVREVPGRVDAVVGDLGPLRAKRAQQSDPRVDHGRPRERQREAVEGGDPEAAGHASIVAVRGRRSRRGAPRSCTPHLESAGECTVAARARA